MWAYRRDDPSIALAAIEYLLRYEVSVINFDEECAREFGRVRAELRQRGIEVSTVDLMIASVALRFDLTLVTHNTGDFRHLPSLPCEDWLSP